MKKMMAAAVAAATFAVSAPAMAAVTYENIALSPAGSPVQFGTFVIKETATASGLSRYYDFIVPGAGVIAGQVNNISVVASFGIELTSIVFNEGTAGAASAFATPQSTTNVLSLSNVAAAAGRQTLRVNYNVLNAGVATGNVSWASQAAVPEPATWALMILGFGVVGYSLRRRPSVRFAQAI